MPGHHSELIEKLRRGEVSAILCYDLDSQFELDFKPLATLPPYALVAASHRLARRRTVSLAELCERDSLFLLDLPISRDYFLDMFRETGIQPEIGGQYQNLDVVRSLVARGTGFSLLNVRPRNKSALDGRPLSYVPLKGTGRSLIYGTARLAGVHPTAKLSAFLEFCNELLAGKPLPGTD
ncbi:LysR family transcriptional regulator [Acetobacter oeni LMG 21952]|nr:LysR family transcriptional regulator [Acetobacter oeni LMG 21952]